MSFIELTEEEYYRISDSYRGQWTQGVIDFRGDIPQSYLGKRTMLTNENGATVLLTEGINFIIKGEPI